MGQTREAPKRPRSKADVQEELVGDQLFLYRAENKEAVHCLNSGAAVIWLLCDGTRDEVSMAREVSETYHVPEPVVLEDIRLTLARLKELGLLEPNQNAG